MEAWGDDCVIRYTPSAAAPLTPAEAALLR